MNKRHHFDTRTEAGDRVGACIQTLLTLPPNFFAIPMGLAGLAGVWQLAAKFYGLSTRISAALYIVTTVVYLLLVVAFGCKLLLAWKTTLAELSHPVFGPFNVLLPIVGMLLALGLDPYAHRVALGLFLAFLVASLLLGGWMLGRWIAARRDLDTLHSGYYLPTVASGLIGSEGLARFGFMAAGWMCFGIGMICWLLLGSIIFNRLFTRPALPQGLIPTLAIEIAPPALAGNAYFTLTGSRIDLLTYLFAGYALLMLLVQLCLVPLYRKLPFVMGFWSFTFPFAAATAYAIRWVHLLHPAGSIPLSIILLAAITLLIGSIALRSLAVPRSKPLPGIAAS